MSAYQWVASHTRAVLPSRAVQAGIDKDGSQIYVGRSRFLNDELPCKIIPKRQEAYVCYDGREHTVSTYEVMVENRLSWIRHCGGRIPISAVSGGRTSNGETLYIGRARHGGALTVGKVHPSHGCLYIPFDGKEISYRDYEILVVQ